MHSLIGVLTAVAIIGCLALYLLPTLIAVIRRAPDTATVAILNILLGWTLIGWILCLVLALRKPAAPPSVQVITHMQLPRDSADDQAA